MVELVFWLSLFLIFFAYFGYPLTLLLISRYRGKDVSRKAITPTVTFLITVHNEQNRIKEKLENALSLNYPGEKIQIIVASDGSTDQTKKIVGNYLDRGVELLDICERKGKENAQKEAVAISKGDIIVFSDVATVMEKDGLKNLVANFADRTVGCVSSEDRLVDREGNISGEGFYVRYEMWLRSVESKVSSLVGLSGSLFAARKTVCEDFSDQMQSDFRTVLNSIKMGMRGVSDPLTIGYYKDTRDSRKEFDRKARTVLRGLTVLFNHLDLLNAFKYGLFSYQLFCHKLLRWSVPYLLILAFVANICLAFTSGAYAVVLVGHLIFYIIGTAGQQRGGRLHHNLVKIPQYFINANMAILIAWWRYFRGKRIVRWTPTER